MMLIPDFLQAGDNVIVISPSGPIDKEILSQGVAILESWGLLVSIGTYATAKHGVFAGNDHQRLADLQEALSNPKYKAIFCARGGYGAIRIVEQASYSQFLAHPKWIVGFSDITVFHSKLSTLGICSLHAAMPKNFTRISTESLESLQAILFGNIHPIAFQGTQYNKSGTCTGKLTGGNLSILYSIRGTSFEYDYENSILFIEDLHEYLYHIDRIMQNLKHAGILSKIGGLVVGFMSGMKQGADKYNASIEGIILDAVKEYSYPVCFNFPSGHESENMALIIGQEYHLEVSHNTCMLNVAYKI